MLKKIAIIQSNYIPWKGYFDIINSVDEFILYDEMQYTKNDWRNRNQIITNQGKKWLTIPVRNKSLNQKINETEVAQDNWAEKHWKTICTNYSKAAFYKKYEKKFSELYKKQNSKFLSQINYSFIIEINRILGITTKISWSTDYEIGIGKTQRLINLCKQAGANIYLSSPAAKNYIDDLLFEKSNIEIEWFDYSGYPEYSQSSLSFDHNVSIIDLIFNCGPDSNKYMKSLK